MVSVRFPRTARVREKSDFDRIFEHGRRVALPVLALHFQLGQAPARLGLAVSRKVDPHAVGRNRIKRILRDHFRHCRDRLAPGDYVLVARPDAARRTPAQLRDAFDQLLRRAGALPLPTPAGTMPADRPDGDCPPGASPPSH